MRLPVAALLIAAACGPSGSGVSLSSRGWSSGFGGGIGPICGDRAIVGEVIPGIDGPGGCGISRPVQVHAVSGVKLAPPPTLTCEAARALERWVARSAKPEVAGLRQRLVGLDVAAGYTCRNRNRASTGRLSEHGLGNAIDIAAFRLDGQVVTVVDGWSSARYGPMLRRIHAAACGPFSTTLGPGSDGFHEEHLHYDVERREHGAYCR